MFKKQDYKDQASAMAFLGISGLGWLLILIAFSLLVTAIWLGVEKWRQNRLTAITRQTNQYVTTQQTSIQVGLQEIAANMVDLSKDPDNATLAASIRAANMAICNRIKTAAQRIDPQYVPQELYAVCP